MNSTEAKLIEVGNALARTLGHATRCPKVSSAVPCVCGQGRAQAKALDDWDQLVADIKTEQCQ